MRVAPVRRRLASLHTCQRSQRDGTPLRRSGFWPAALNAIRERRCLPTECHRANRSRPEPGARSGRSWRALRMRARQLPYALNAGNFTYRCFRHTVRYRRRHCRCPGSGPRVGNRLSHRSEQMAEEALQYSDDSLQHPGCCTHTRHTRCYRYTRSRNSRCRGKPGPLGRPRTPPAGHMSCATSHSARRR